MVFFGKSLVTLKLREHYRATVLTIKWLLPEDATLLKPLPGFAAYR
jgi:hypothetical protein